MAVVDVMWRYFAPDKQKFIVDLFISLFARINKTYTTDKYLWKSLLKKISKKLILQL